MTVRSSGDFDVDILRLLLARALGYQFGQAP